MAHANRAMAYLKMGRYGDAERDCSAALELDALYLKAWQRRATARRVQGKLPEAVADFEQALRSALFLAGQISSLACGSSVTPTALQLFEHRAQRSGCRAASNKQRWTPGAAAQTRAHSPSRQVLAAQAGAHQCQPAHGQRRLPDRGLPGRGSHAGRQLCLHPCVCPDWGRHCQVSTRLSFRRRSFAVRAQKADKSRDKCQGTCVTHLATSCTS